jgi:N-acetylglucosamine-6-phosphate deacetylase
VRNPDFGEFEAWQNAARGRIKIVTLAPEKKGAIDFIERITDTGVVAAIGHTDAPAELIHAAARAGARLSTHLGNGSHSLLPRLDNYIWEQLANDELCASIVTDGFHLPSAVVKVFRRAKDPSRLILVSDVSPLGGLKPGKYRWGNIKVEIHENGYLGLPGTSILAGSGHMLDWDIPHFMAATNSLLDEAVRLCTENPARLLSLPYTYGKLETGSPANLVLFRVKEGSPRLEVEQTIRNGKTVFAAGTMTGPAP